MTWISRQFLFAALAAAACFAATVPAAAQAAGYGNWAAVVVAGDNRAHDGGHSEAFDNARRDVSNELERLGFSAGNLDQFSIEPERHPETHPEEATAQNIANGLWDLSNRTSGGCLLYFSSHGSPQGLILGETVLQPDALATMTENACGDRPTVVIVSACYSGVFVPAMAAPNRLVITAARSDRTSFGCGQDDRYPYFDTCVLQQMPAAGSFPRLAGTVRKCVARREQQTGMRPPSDPQVAIGAEVAPELPTWGDAGPQGARSDPGPPPFHD